MPVPGSRQPLLGCVAGLGVCRESRELVSPCRCATGASLLILLPGGAALHLQQLRPAIVFICFLVVFDVLQEKMREKINEEVGGMGQVCSMASLQITSLTNIFCRQVGETCYKEGESW